MQDSSPDVTTALEKNTLAPAVTDAELAEAWDAAAWRYQIYPLDEGTGLKFIQRPPTENVLKQPVTIHAGTTFDELRQWRKRAYSFCIHK